MARKKKNNKKRLTKTNVLKAYGLDKKLKPGDVQTSTYGTGIGPYYVMYLNKNIKGFGKEGESVVGNYKSTVQAKVDSKSKPKKRNSKKRK